MRRPREAGEVGVQVRGGRRRRPRGRPRTRPSRRAPRTRSGRRPSRRRCGRPGWCGSSGAGAAVGDALAAGPADLLEQVGHRLGEDDVGGGDGEPVAQRPAPALGGAADREHRGAGAHRAAGGPRLDPVRAPSRSARTGERLVDLDAAPPAAARAGRAPAAPAAPSPSPGRRRRRGRPASGSARRPRSALERLRHLRRPRARGRRRPPRSQTPSWAGAVETWR